MSWDLTLSDASSLKSWLGSEHFVILSIQNHHASWRQHDMWMLDAYLEVRRSCLVLPVNQSSQRCPLPSRHRLRFPIPLDCLFHRLLRRLLSHHHSTSRNLQIVALAG